MIRVGTLRALRKAHPTSFGRPLSRGPRQAKLLSDHRNDETAAAISSKVGKRLPRPTILSVSSVNFEGLNNLMEPPDCLAEVR